MRVGLHGEVNTYHAWFIYIEAVFRLIQTLTDNKNNYTIHRLHTFMEIEVLWEMLLYEVIEDKMCTGSLGRVYSGVASLTASADRMKWVTLG